MAHPYSFFVIRLCLVNAHPFSLRLQANGMRNQEF